DEINRRTNAYCAEHPDGQPSELLMVDWYRENVILNPAAAGAVRSLLGKNFGLPVQMANHRTTGPMPAQAWHRDAGARYGPDVPYLQVFYLPQTTTRAMGPTEILPGSHFLFN